MPADTFIYCKYSRTSTVFSSFPNQSGYPTTTVNILQLLVDKETSHTLTSSNTHAGQKNLLLLPSALAQARYDLSSASGTKGMAESDGTAADVHLGVVNVELIQTVDGHAGKGLVELDDIDVIDGDVVLGEQLGDGNGRADTHDAWSKAGNSGADELGHDGLAELLGEGSFHEENGSCAVGDLRRITAM